MLSPLLFSGGVLITSLLYVPFFANFSGFR